jgi:hypothetical protein
MTFLRGYCRGPMLCPRERKLFRPEQSQRQRWFAWSQNPNREPGGSER